MKKILVFIFVFNLFFVNSIFSECVDSDGGNEPYIYGEVETPEYPNFSSDDWCWNETRLKEYYCNNGNSEHAYINCDYRCVIGRCVKEGITCIDTDGGIDGDKYGETEVDVTVNDISYHVRIHRKVVISPKELDRLMDEYDRKRGIVIDIAKNLETEIKLSDKCSDMTEEVREFLKMEVENL